MYTYNNSTCILLVHSIILHTLRRLSTIFYFAYALSTWFGVEFKASLIYATLLSLISHISCVKFDLVGGICWLFCVTFRFVVCFFSV